VVVSLLWLLPQWYPLARASPPAAGAVPVRVFDANVEYTNRDLTGVAGEIRREQPNVIALEELTDANLRSLRATGVLTHYRWQFTAPLANANGLGVWSDIPMSDAELVPGATFPEINAWLQPSGSARVRLYVVHTVAAVGGGVGAWKANMAAIATEARETPRPAVFVGDFNATWDMFEFQNVLHDGMQDSAVEAGKGWEMTWSRQLPVVPPFARIDHLLYSSGVTVTGYRTGIGTGSDHRPIEVQLAVARRPNP
jgi:endonuclease/exonuclease/phosphatase (EEP) superfamily protein YafD